MIVYQFLAMLGVVLVACLLCLAIDFLGVKKGWWGE